MPRGLAYVRHCFDLMSHGDFSRCTHTPAPRGAGVCRRLGLLRTIVEGVVALHAVVVIQDLLIKDAAYTATGQTSGSADR